MCVNMNWEVFCSFMQSFSYIILMSVECFLCPGGLRMWSQLKECKNVLFGSMLQFHWCHDASMGKACQKVKLLLLESIHLLLLHINYYSETFYRHKMEVWPNWQVVLTIRQNLFYKLLLHSSVPAVVTNLDGHCWAVLWKFFFRTKLTFKLHICIFPPNHVPSN